MSDKKSNLNFSSMMPGWALDALVGTLVMGWRAEPGFGLMDGEKFMEVDGPWCPSTNISDAMMVVEKMRLMVFPSSKGWSAALADADALGIPEHGDFWIDAKFNFLAEAETMPLAICRAALVAAIDRAGAPPAPLQRLVGRDVTTTEGM